MYTGENPRCQTRNRKTVYDARMRRSEKAIEHREEIDQVIRACTVVRLGLSENEQPYVVPLNFGYDGSSLYFHCAREGRKIDILQKNNRVCLEFDIPEEVVQGEAACAWGMHYRSVIAFGTARQLSESEDKRRGLEAIMAQYSDRTFTFPDAAVERTAVFMVEIEKITGKQSPRDA